jgi:integrase
VIERLKRENELAQGRMQAAKSRLAKPGWFRRQVDLWHSRARRIHTELIRIGLRELGRSSDPQQALQKAAQAEVKDVEDPDPATPRGMVNPRSPRSMKIVSERPGKYTLKWTTSEGRNRRITTEATSLTEANQLFAQSGVTNLVRVSEATRLNAKLVRMLDPGHPNTLKAAVDQYLAFRQPMISVSTLSAHRTAFYAFIRDSGAKRITDFTAEAINAYVNRKDSTKLSTRKLTLKRLTMLGEYLRNKGWLDASPAKLVKVDARLLTAEQKLPAVKRAFTEEEMDKLLAISHPVSGGWTPPRSAVVNRWRHVGLWNPHGETLRFFHFAIAMSRWTGLRISDIATCEWEAFNADLTEIRVVTRKTEAFVQLPIHPRLKEAIELSTSLLTHRTGYIWPQMKQRYVDPTIKSSLPMWFTALQKKAGVPGNGFHSLRYAYILECKKQGIAMPHIAQNVGHSYWRQTQGYIDRATSNPDHQLSAPSPSHDAPPSL